LTDADLQAENIEQEREIRLGLADMINLSPDALKAQRYYEDQHKTKSWSIITLLDSHFVPTHPGSLDANAFYHDVKAREARAAIKKQLFKLDKIMKAP